MVLWRRKTAWPLDFPAWTYTMWVERTFDAMPITRDEIVPPHGQTARPVD
jgi:hypothetical protein